MDLNKGFAQLLKDVSDELFNDKRTPETNVKYALRRMAAIFAKQAKEGLEISSSQLSILENLNTLTIKQKEQNDLARGDIDRLNRWMLRLTFLGALFAAASLVLTWVVAKGYIDPAPKSTAASIQKSDPAKETGQAIVPQPSQPTVPPQSRD